MPTWAWAAIGSFGAFLAWSAWLFYAGKRVGEAPVPALEAHLEVAEERLKAARLALASEIEAAQRRAGGAMADWERERALRDAASDPDPDARVERLREVFRAAQAAAAAPGEQAPASDGGGDPAADAAGSGEGDGA